MGDGKELDALLGQLVLGYRVMGMHGLGLGILAHLTARLPGTETFWSYQLGQSVEEVRVSDLRESTFDAKTLDGRSRVNPTFRSHGAIYSARPDVLCVLHHHSDNCVALGAVGSNLVSFDNNAARWDGEIALAEDFENVLAIEEQGPAFVQHLGHRKALLLKHHGVMVVGKSVADAVVASLELDRSMGVQLKAMAAGTLHVMGKHQVEEAKKFLASETALDLNWAYQLRLLHRCGGDLDLQ